MNKKDVDRYFEINWNRKTYFKRVVKFKVIDK